MRFGRKLLLSFGIWIALSYGLTYPNTLLGGSMVGYGMFGIILAGLIHRKVKGRWN